MSIKTKLTAALITTVISTVGVASANESYLNSYAAELNHCAKQQSKVKNFKDSEYLRKLAKDAKNGHLRYPERAPVMTAPNNRIPELQQARSDVIRFLDLKLYDIAPDLTAKTQASYECWLRAESNSKAQSSDYRDTYYSNRAALNAYSMATVFYRPDSAVLSSTAKNKLRTLVRTMKANGIKDVALQTHASTTASHIYNLELTRKRADVLERFLRSQGVKNSRVILRTYTEGYNTRPEGNNKEIRDNRRARVYLIPAQTSTAY